MYLSVKTQNQWSKILPHRCRVNCLNQKNLTIIIMFLWKISAILLGILGESPIRKIIFTFDFYLMYIGILGRYNIHVKLWEIFVAPQTIEHLRFFKLFIYSVWVFMHGFMYLCVWTYKWHFYIFIYAVKMLT